MPQRSSARCQVARRARHADRDAAGDQLGREVVGLAGARVDERVVRHRRRRRLAAVERAAPARSSRRSRRSSRRRRCPALKGSVTPSAAAVATAASTALPPCLSTRRPTCDASGSTEETAPPKPVLVAVLVGVVALGTRLGLCRRGERRETRQRGRTGDSQDGETACGRGSWALPRVASRTADVPTQRRHASTARSTRSGSSQSTQVIRGSLRNHASWRRANWRVRATVASNASASVHSPGEERQHLLVAQRPARRTALPQATRRPAGAPRRRGRRPTSARPAALDPLVEHRPRDADADLDGAGVEVPLLRQRRAERPAGELDDLEGADHPAAVARQDPRGGLRVGLGSRSCSAAARRAASSSSSRPRTRRRCRGTRTGRAPRGCTAPSRRPAPGPRPGRGSRRRPRGPAPGTARPSRARCTSSRSSRWCGNAAALLGRQLGGADVHAAVDLHGVGVDHLAAEPLAPGRARGRSCPRRWAHDGDHRGGGRVRMRSSLASGRRRRRDQPPRERRSTTWVSWTRPRSR